MKAHFLWVAVRMEAGGKMAVSPSATEMLLPFPSHDVELASSWVKQREDLNTAFLRSLEPDRLLHNFRVNAGLSSVAKPLEGWESPGVGLRGHFVGHYLSAVSALVERYEDAGLARNLEKVVEGMYACQQAHGNGYLSAFPETDIEVLETRFTGVWAPYYTLHKIMQGLLAGKVDYAVLGEPFLSIALRKDSTLQILADLNKPDSASLGFAQTAILYVPTLKKSKETIDSLLNTSCRFAVEQPEQAICILEKENIFTFGMLTPESIERCKIDYKTVSEAQENILHFLQLIEQYEPKALGGKMPDEQFYK